MAEESGGRLLLRIEDLDRTRCKAAFEAAILDDLAWLGVRFDACPRRQSEHGEEYAAALERLRARGLVYPCFCSRADVARFAIGRDPDDAPLYGGRCRALSETERRSRLERGEKVAWRLDSSRARTFAPKQITWLEYGEGETASERPANPAVWGDVVVRGRDLEASYHLAVTVDDGLQGVTDVVRGRDLLAATAVHRLLQDLLGFPAPRYRHHRLVLDANGDKLSKTRRSPSLAAIRASGVVAEAVRRALSLSADAEAAFGVALS